MKKILKEGTKKVVEFECPECGCKFATDEYSYFEVAGFFENSFEIHISCECGMRIKKPLK